MAAARHFPAELQSLAAIRHFVEDAATELGADPEILPTLVQAVDESATNIVVHGYRGRPGTIDVAVTREGSTLGVRLRDQAPLFDPTSVPPPDLDLPLEARPIGGLGVHLARRCVDEMIYRVTPAGHNELTLLKRNVSFNHA